jgi:YegS/Rv2252/BmrU family lipid kinase
VRARELGLDGEVLVSERPGHLTELAREAAGEGKLLVVVGGDGTLNEVANGISGSDAEVAVLPNGTGQDFGRTHGIPTKFDDAVRVALTGEARPVDLGRAVYRDPSGAEASRVFANVGSAGMSGAVALRANSMSKALGGRATFYYALVREFARWKNTEVIVSYDDGERRGRMHDVIVANGRWHGGGMKLAPDAHPDDGLFDIVLIGDVTKLDFVTTSPKLYHGGHVGHRRVEVLRSAAVGVEAAVPIPLELDGEVAGTTPVRFEIVPAALRLRTPA